MAATNAFHSRFWRGSYFLEALVGSSEVGNYVETATSNLLSFSSPSTKAGALYPLHLQSNCGGDVSMYLMYLMYLPASSLSERPQYKVSSEQALNHDEPILRDDNCINVEISSEPTFLNRTDRTSKCKLSIHITSMYIFIHVERFLGPGARPASVEDRLTGRLYECCGWLHLYLGT